MSKIYCSCIVKTENDAFDVERGMRLVRARRVYHEYYSGQSEKMPKKLGGRAHLSYWAHRYFKESFPLLFCFSIVSDFAVQLNVKTPTNN